MQDVIKEARKNPLFKKYSDIAYYHLYLCEFLNSKKVPKKYINLISDFHQNYE